MPLCDRRPETVKLPDMVSATSLAFVPQLFLCDMEEQPGKKKMFTTIRSFVGCFYLLFGAAVTHPNTICLCISLRNTRIRQSCAFADYLTFFFFPRREVIVRERGVNRWKWQVGCEDQREEPARVRRRAHKTSAAKKNNISGPPTFTTPSASPSLHVIKPIVTFN